MSDDDSIDEWLRGHDVVLFMNGTRVSVQDGYSWRVHHVLYYLGVTRHDVDVSKNPALERIIGGPVPQLYVKGTRVGGWEAVTEMMLSGALEELFDEQGIEYSKENAIAIREGNS